MDGNKKQSTTASSLNENRRFWEYGNGQNPSPLNLSDYSPSRYITISGQTEVTVRDEMGNTASIQDGFLNNQVEGLSSYEVIGDNSIMLTLSVGHNYTIEFPTGETPVAIDLVEGRETPHQQQQQDIRLGHSRELQFKV